MSTEIKIDLVELIKLYPWLIDVANSDYDRECAEKILISESYKILRDRM